MRSFLLVLAAAIAIQATAFGQCSEMTSKKSTCGEAPVMTMKQDSSCCSSQQANLTSTKQDIVSTAIGAGSFNTLVAAVKAAGLVETLQGDGPFTVFAPSDEAFKKIPSEKLKMLLKPENKALLTSILTYHVVPGRVPAEQVVKLKNATTANGQRVDVKTDKNGVFIDGAKVVTPNIDCSNGIIHVIDTVIIPSTDDLIDTAVSAGSFKTLAQALTAAGLVSALKADGPFTVFAPTDEAFAKLPKDLVASLLKPENKKKLTAILTYHVVPGRVYADQVVGLKQAKSLEGSPIMIKVDNGAVMLNGSSKVIKTDIETKNGVIHVINSVILPGAGA